ncbi:hypothetical protein C4J81_06645 [Deltaproteobacteria bacterium Smac51]|nr:hypothetical protein C4J81_06645 [Deltaproteobacteria bacterium Smac51]
MTTGRSFIQHIKLLFIAVLTLAFLGAGLSLPSTAEAQNKKNQSQAKAQKSGAKSSSKKNSTGKSGSQSSKKTQAQKAAELPWPQNLLTLVGDGAVLVMDTHAPRGATKELYAHNAEREYVPASILKIVTSAAALEFLGPDYRFKTDFLLTKDKDLWIVGYGDPYLVSEELTRIVNDLQEKGLKEVRNIYLDSSYFERDLILDGNTQTRNPYDAYNGALAVNFNTLNFKKNKKGHVVKAANHLPLTPMALDMAKKFKKSGTYCLNISESPAEAELHAGQTFKAHLEEAGVKVKGEIYAGQTAPSKRKVFHRHVSSRSLDETLKELMKYSNNFMTNQIFLTMGAELYGAPANLDKAQKAMDAYFKKHSLPRIVMGDGSGLSRQTTLTARQMAAVLEVVEANRHIFSSRDDGRVRCKTGTMSDIKTLAGFMERPDAPDQPLSFVILLNGATYTSATRDQVLGLLKHEFITSSPSAGR